MEWRLDNPLQSSCFIFGRKSKMVATTDQSLTYMLKWQKKFKKKFRKKSYSTVGYWLTHDTMEECTSFSLSETTNLIEPNLYMILAFFLGITEIQDCHYHRTKFKYSLLLGNVLNIFYSEITENHLKLEHDKSVF